MHAISHLLNIGTFATWLSVGAFGTVGVIIPGWDEVFVSKTAAPMESAWILPDITLGDAAPTENTEASAENANLETLEPLAPPPELPEIAELPPLPEVPDLPPPPQRVEKVSSIAPAARPTAPPSEIKPTRTRTSTAATSGPAGNGKPGATGSGVSTGMSDSARLAAGRMSSPSYPPYSRRNNQTGTVLVDFTVDASGRVISASVKKSSSWPLLDNEAVRDSEEMEISAGWHHEAPAPHCFQIKLTEIPSAF